MIVFESAGVCMFKSNIQILNNDFTAMKYQARNPTQGKGHQKQTYFFKSYLLSLENSSLTDRDKMNRTVEICIFIFEDVEEYANNNYFNYWGCRKWSFLVHIDLGDF